MTVSDAQKRANAKFEREKTRSIKIKLTISTDADILAKLDAVGNKQGYWTRSGTSKDISKLS